MRFNLGLATLLGMVATFSLVLAADSPTTTPAAPAADEAAIKKLVADLGRQEAAVRDAAQKRLVEIGIPSRPALLAAAQGDDPEVRTRAKAALGQLVEVTVKDLGPVPEGYVSLIFSPDGRHVAYIAYRNRKQILVCDGKEGPEWDQINLANSTYMHAGLASPFATDGSLVYAAQAGAATFTVTVGREDQAVSRPWGIGVPVRSADGKHLAYATRKDNQSVLVFDGKEVASAQSLSPDRFLADNETLVCHEAAVKSDPIYVIGGRRLGPQEGVGDRTLSPDGKRLALTLRQKDKTVVLCDGKEGQACDEVGPVVFSPDSKNFAYTGLTKGGADAGGFIFLNGKKAADAKEARELRFTHDGRQLIWETGDDKDKVLAQVFDLATGKTTAVPLASRLAAFSPDGKHVAGYTGDGNGKVLLTVDGKSLPPAFDSDSADGEGSHTSRLDLPGFSADDRHVFCRGVRKIHEPYDHKRFMVVDGQPRPEHDNLWIPADFQNGAKALRYLVRDNNRLRLVETYWPEDTTWEKAAGAAAK
jgi:hypothetical protein